MEMKSILAAPFNANNYNNFILEFFNEIDRVTYKEIKPNATFVNAIDYYSVHGTYKDPDGNDIIVLSVKVKNNSNARQAQRNFVSYLLTNDFNQYSAAMVAYYDDVRTNWKLSFVTVEMELGDNGIELKFKPAKRFSFLVGENEPTRTYTQQLGPVYTSRENPTLDRITEAFSINKLSKDFYDDYKKKFFELYDYLVNNSAFCCEANKLGYKTEEDVEKFVTTFCKKTLGQIMFLHFVQKKGWLGVTDVWGDGDKQYLINSIKSFNSGNYFDEVLEPLFYNALNAKRENNLYLGKKVPFLNGGLFQPIEEYDWKNTNFDIPNDYWYNDHETGLLNILSQYNFTVDESSLEEQEVAIDPEMLGKIFESLLDVRDRAKLGAFYTPREIVNYMCEEALAVRISNELNLDYDSILNFIRYGDALKETEFIETFAEEIDEYVTKLTIVDPAVGSGAFLVGMLNQIVKLRTNLLGIYGKNIDKYEIKIGVIQNSLYGVDIEYDAVEIAKLRLWLSLVVDQDSKEEGPKPLPNLNFHLRVGNSLVDTFDGIKLWNIRWRSQKKHTKVDNQMNLFNVDTVASIMYRLKNAKNEFFRTSEEKRKNELSKQIEREQIELIRAELVAKGKFSLFEQIDDMLKRKTKPFFIWELEFEEVFENGGFDIVIGNPPYGLVNKKQNKSDTIVVPESELNLYKTDELYKPAKGGVINIYRLFICKSIDLLKNDGCLNLIFPMAFMGDLSASALRKHIFENMTINYIEAFPERDDINKRVFQSAKMSVCILNATNAKLNSKFKVRTQDDRFVNLSYPYVEMDTSDLKIIEPKGYTIPLVNQREYDLLKKLNNNTNKLINFSKCYTGEIDLSLNKKYYGLVKNDTPLLRGAQVQRWYTTENISQGDLLYIDKNLYLSENSSPKSQHYKNKRIVMQGITGVNEKYRLKMTLISNNEFCANSVNYLLLENDDENELMYLLGILNSSLINWYFKKFSTNSNVNGYEIDNIPIMMNDKYKDELVSLVKKQLIGPLEENEVKINEIVLKIYGVTDLFLEIIGKK